MPFNTISIQLIKYAIAKGIAIALTKEKGAGKGRLFIPFNGSRKVHARNVLTTKRLLDQ